jgi:Flp pilus assembly protein TadD
MSSTASQQTLSNYWAFGPVQDLAFILATPIAIFLLFTVAEGQGWIDALLAFALASAMGHYLPGILRAYGDRALFQRFRTRLIAAPLLLVGLTTTLAYFNFNFVFLLVGLWGAWHWTMQVYGFARIYDAKSGPASTPALLDRALCLLWFGVCVFVLNDALQVYVARFYQTGGSPLPAVSVRWLTQSWLGATIVLTIVYLVYALLRTRAGYFPNPIKWLFIAVTFLYLSYTASRIDRPVIGYAMFEMWHDIQYLAIVWLFNLSRARRNPEAGRLIRFLFRPKAALAFAYIGVCLAFGSLTHAWRLFEDATIVRIVASIVPAAAMMHYYLDGFIWRIREPETRAALGVAAVEISKPIASFTPAPPVRHAALWLLLIVPAGVLFAMESKSTPDRPALLVYKDLVQTFPNSPNAQYELGRELQEVGRLMEGKVHLERALALNPRSYPALVHLGVLLADQQDFAGARPYLERAVEMNPRDVEVRNNLGIVLDELGELERARVQLEVALSLDPAYALAHSNLGIVLGKMGDLDDAEQHFRESLRIDPQSAPTHNSLGEVLLKLARTKDAKASFEQALRLSPDFRPAQQNLAALEKR